MDGYNNIKFSPLLNTIAISCLNEIHSHASNQKYLLFVFQSSAAFQNGRDSLYAQIKPDIKACYQNMGYTFIMILNHNKINFWFYINNHFFFTS